MNLPRPHLLEPDPAFTTVPAAPAALNLPSSLPRVAVFNADYPPALAFVRSLGRRGVPVDVYSPERLSICRASRYAARTLPCPPLDDSTRFTAWLRERLAKGEIERIAPTSDTIAWLLAECWDALGEPMRRSIADPDDVFRCLFKPRLHEACEAAGGHAPQTWYPISLEEAQALAPTLPYPVVIKPRSHVAVGLERGRLVGTPAQFLAHFGPYAGGPGRDADFARYPELRWPMVQRYLPSSRDAVYSVSGFIGADGQVVAHAACVKTGQWPPSLGIGTEFQSCFDQDVLDAGLRLAPQLVSRGLFELEFLRDSESGRLLAIDLNTRGYGQIALDIARGNDLPWLWYLATMGLTPLPASAPLEDHCWRNFAIYHISHWLSVLRGPRRLEKWRRYRAGAGRGSVDASLSLDDPWPGLLFQLNVLRHPLGLLRPVVKRRRDPRLPAASGSA